MPIAMMAFSADAPKTAVIITAIRRLGNANTRSFVRMMISSGRLPLRAAAASPRGTPTSMPIPTATSATAIDVRAPTISMLRMSRPN